MGSTRPANYKSPARIGFALPALGIILWVVLGGCLPGSESPFSRAMG